MSAERYSAARLALEGNPVFTNLRMELAVLKEQNAALLEALEAIRHETWIEARGTTAEVAIERIFGVAFAAMRVGGAK